MIPLWTTTRSPPQSRWGCAFRSFGAPWVAQRVCPTPTRAGAANPFSRIRSSSRSSRPLDPEQPLRVFLGLLNEGILLSQRGLGCLSAAMGEAEVERFVEALGRVLDREAAR